MNLLLQSTTLQGMRDSRGYQIVVSKGGLAVDEGLGTQLFTWYEAPAIPLYALPLEENTAERLYAYTNKPISTFPLGCHFPIKEAEVKDGQKYV